MSDRLFVSTRKGLFTIQRTGTGAPHWAVTRASFLGDNVTLVYPDSRNGRVYAVLDHGHFGIKMHSSTDCGVSWQECAVPAYPTPPSDRKPDVCPMSGIVIPWSLKLIWALAGGGSDEPDVLWCGTVPGGLFRSDNGGESWHMIRSLWDQPDRKHWFGGGLDYPGIHSICVHPRDAKHITVGVSCGGVWQTRDRGETWTCRAEGMWAAYMPPERKNDPAIQDPHCMVQCRKSPDVFWVQHHNGVFRSTDGSASWSEVTNAAPSTFGFAVAVHPSDAETAWFVPAISDEKRIPVDGKVVISRTRDGGKTFDVLTEGLPQEHAYDLTFRHALDIDESGNRLAFGSTTGSLWVSEDQGDTWQTVTTQLPPVYSVRFE